MKIYTLKDSSLPGERVITLGAFDGIHLGHQNLIHKTIELSQELGLPPALVTFDPHPRKVLQPHLSLELLTPLEEKLEYLKKFNLSELIIIPFTKALAELTAELFIEKYLVDYLHIRGLVIGFNFRFGRNRTGTPDLLKNLGSVYGFQVEVLPPITIDGIRVSSTTIRELLKEGKVEEANRLLGRPYSLTGRVVRGKGRGRELGYPTANIELPKDKLIPAPGVYAVWTIVEGQKYPGALNIGYKPTFNERELTVEVHILNCNSPLNLYEKLVTVELVKFIRGEKKFHSVEALIAQIQQDCLLIRNILEANRSAVVSSIPPQKHHTH